MQYGDTVVPLSEDHSFTTAREMMRLKAHEMAEVSDKRISVYILVIHAMFEHFMF